MQKYEYRPLDQSLEEIRLLRLLPGSFKDKLCVEMFHASLRDPTIPPISSRLSLKELRKTLPKEWNAFETLERDIIFADRHRNLASTHPDPNFDSPLHGPVPDHPGPTFEPKYEALSYTWDPQLPRERVCVQSQDRKVRFGLVRHCNLTVGRNLALALRHLRYPQESRVLWIDAISIDQRNNGERNEQVKRMGKIFSFAQRVVVWLGESTHNSDKAMETLDFLGAQAEPLVGHGWGASLGGSKRDWFKATTKLPYETETWKAIESLLSRPWFARTWVWQEIQLANRHSIVQCGKTYKSWPTLR